MTGPRVAVYVSYVVAIAALVFRRRFPLACALVVVGALAGEWLVFGSPEVSACSRSRSSPGTPSAPMPSVAGRSSGWVPLLAMAVTGPGVTPRSPVPTPRQQPTLALPGLRSRRSVRPAAASAIAPDADRERRSSAAGRSPPSGRGSPASCTTSSLTTSASWSSRPRPPTRCSRADPRARARAAFDAIAGRPAGGADRHAAGCSACCRDADRPPARAAAGHRAASTVLLVEQVARGGPAGRADHRRAAAAAPRRASTSSAYRIVQEALTNALKHARPAHARASASRYGTDALDARGRRRRQRRRRRRRRRRARPGRDARAGRRSAAVTLRRRATARAAASSCAPGSRSRTAHDPRPDRRRPGRSSAPACG